MSHLYALLVGINEYPRKPLKGCVNDAHAWRCHLEELYGKGDRLGLELLVNQEATRQAILDRFRGHLGQAGEGDTAFFCFSGHGSQEVAPEPWCFEEPGGLSETLVAVDSRVEGGLDIADKELAVLIAEVARGGAHVVVVLDSCHSGTATRDADAGLVVRRMEGSRRRRPAGSYWFEGDDSVPAELDVAGGWRVLPTGPHVLLAACEDYQTAVECTAGEGTKRGLFSYYFLDTLARSGPGRSYQDLFQQAQVRVQNAFPDQLPQAEGELDRGFMGGAVARGAGRYHARRHRDGSWWLNAGAVHGVQVSTEVAVLPLEEADTEDVSGRLAIAQVAKVEAGESRIEPVEGDLSGSAQAYPVLVTRLPLPPVRVAFTGEAPGWEPLREGIERSPYLVPAAEPSAANLEVVLEPERWRLRRPGTGRDLVPPPEDGDDSPGRVVEALEHAARWQTVADLANPGSPLADAVEMTLWEWTEEEEAGSDSHLRLLPAEGEHRLPYRETAGGELLPPRFSVHLVNRGGEPVYYALAGLSESFAVQVLGGGGGRLAGGEETWVGRAGGITASVPDTLHERGLTRRRDLLVLLLSSVPTDFTLLKQGEIFEPGRRHASLRSLPPRPGLLDTLLRQVAWRELNERPLVAHQWAAKRQAVVALRPMPWVPFSGGAGDLEPVPGVLLRVPAGLEGTLRLHGPASHPESPGLAALPLEERERLRPIALAGALGSDPGLSALELSGTGWERVTADSPFGIEAELRLADGESLAAVVWDGREARLVPGCRDRSGRDGGWSRCRVGSLPAPAVDGGAVWLELYALRE